MLHPIAVPSRSVSTDVAFLRQTGLFKALPEQHLATLAAEGEQLTCGPGHVLVQQGSKGGDLFVVKSGVLEARDESGGKSTLVGYVFPGECVGEMSLLTGSPRSVSVRVPEYAELIRIPGALFQRLLRSDVEVAVAVARGLALRLERANRNAPSDNANPNEPPKESPSGHLAGDLKYFDVPEVCQTLIQARRTGKMILESDSIAGELWVCFDEGEFRHAKAGPLLSAEAVLYLLRTKMTGRFEFRATDAYPGPKDVKPLKASSMALLLESAQQRDEIDALRAQLPDSGHIFERVGEFPFSGPLAAPVDPDDEDPGDMLRGNWQPTTEADREFAKKLWDSIGMFDPIGILLADRFGREVLTLRILHSLVVNKHVRSRQAQSLYPG